ncbi:MAG: 2-dehydropantoate 2-reductase [Desulfatiglans sp.]|nr:2-dehydropantoate 2-reductase [Desulfatiglans sp.]
MNFLVVGPGAMGCLFASHLKRAGIDVTLLDYRQDRADFINEHGIRVEGVTGNHTVKVPVVVGKSSDIPEVILICVKANQTQRAADALKSWVGDRAYILTVQNGLGNVDILQDIFGRERVLGGITAEGATLMGQGHVRHAGQGDTIIGPQGDPDGPVSLTITDFNRAGFSARAVDNVEDLIWSKLIINVGINALTAITRLKNGRLPHVDGTRSIMEEAVKEAVAIVREKGINLSYPDPLARVLEVCEATADNIASMLQDVLRQGTTEVDYINGAIVREGEKLGLPTPVNQTLTSLVRAIQETYDQQQVPFPSSSQE